MKIIPITLAFVLSLASFSTLAQQKPEISDNQAYCATPVPDKAWDEAFEVLVQQFKSSKTAGKTQKQVFTIPVIVHVIHGGQSVGTYPNISQGQINSQIKVLNDDFGGIGFNSGNYPGTAFKTWAANQSVDSANLDVLGRIQIANCEIQFCLATKDTLGNLLAEPGIERINYVSKGWSNPASFGSNLNTFMNYMNGTIKPGSIWNVTKYFNIWISDVSSSSGLLGYATFPPFAGLTGLPSGFFGTNQTDGVWCWARAFGSAGIFPGGTYAGSNNRGRTATHEVGHWLGLRHIWGDGTCASDFCVDTPPASGQNFGSPNYPFKTTNCSGNSPNGEMFMNFMDYTADAAKYMFSSDQALRMQTAMQNSFYRNQLGTHNLCSLAETPAVAAFNVSSSVCENGVVTFTNISSGNPVPSYTWSSNGAAAISPNANTNLVTMSFSAAGVYTISLAADNGTLSVQTKTITVKAAPQLSFLGAGPVVCLNDDIVLLAAGADSYTWQPGGITGNSFFFTATGPQTLVCSGSNSDNCVSTVTLNFEVDACVGLRESDFSPYMFQLFPNPGTELVNLEFYVKTGSDYKVELSDLNGRLLFSAAFPCESGKCHYQLNTKELENGMYLVNVYSKNGKREVKKFLKQ
ncbi:MAG: zinc-dependent metalloprotease [Bacteroidia bacterium]|jgi:hypothetical protein|nr:zinc-dependent metalloprotease [Bacteroidia bacterium]